MCDDLDKFFAKKASKKNKKVAQDTESLAKRLEKAVKQQEQIDRDREEEEERFQRERAQLEERPADDGDWLDVQEVVELDLTGKGIQDLNIDEINEDDKLIDDERLEKPKTWNTNTANANQTTSSAKETSEDGEVKVPGDEEKIQTSAPEPKRYVPPSRRSAALRANPDSGQVQPNFQDVEEFPSLAAAVDISAKEQEKKKLKALQAKEFDEREKARREIKEKEALTNVWRRREVAPIRSASPSQERLNSKLETESAPMDPTQTKAAPDDAAASAVPKPNVYVPPHLRKLQQ